MADPNNLSEPLPFDVNALLVTRDQKMIAIFSAGFERVKVSTLTADDMATAATYWLRTRIEGIVIDFDGVEDQSAILAELRNHRSNQEATVIAVADAIVKKTVISVSGAQFLVTRPFLVDQVNHTIEAAYRLMVRSRRKHFRLTASIEVSLRTDAGVTIHCSTINLSRNGMAIQTPRPLKVGEVLNLSFLAPGSPLVIKVRAVVVWDDKHGKAGLRFECMNDYIEEHLHNWLDDQCLMWHKVN